MCARFGAQAFGVDGNMANYSFPKIFDELDPDFRRELANLWNAKAEEHYRERGQGCPRASGGGEACPSL